MLLPNVSFSKLYSRRPRGLANERSHRTHEQQLYIITVAVDDLQKSLAFYRDGLGWTPWYPTAETPEPIDHAAFELQNGLSFVLYPRTEIERDVQQPNAPRSSVEFSLTHRVTNKAEVDAILSRAEAAGATLLGRSPEEDWGFNARFKDPDGHLWEIMWTPE